MNHSPLLLNEHPLLILPSLAVKIGLNEAVIFQQVHYWLTHNEKAKSPHHFHDGRWWTYGTYEEWQDRDFPFLSVRAVRRAIKNLEERNLLITGQFNRKSSDRTKWYSIDYEALAELGSESSGSSCGQIGQSTCPEWPAHESKLDNSSISTETINRDSLTRTTTERPKKKASSSSESESAPLDREALEQAEQVAVWLAKCDYWGDDGQPYTYRKTKTLVEACQGHTVESAEKAWMAADEFMSTKRSAGESIRNPQAVLCRALMDRQEPSAEYEAKQRQYEQQQREERERIAKADYTERWLPLAVQYGLIEGVDINYEGQFYGFQYPDEGMPRNANLWELPSRWANVSIEMLQESLMGVAV